MKSIESTHQSSNIHCQLHDLQGWNGEKVTELEYLTVKEFITRSQCQLSDGNRINAEICLLSDSNQRAWSLLELWLLPYLAFLKGGPFFLSAPFPFPFFEASSSSLRFFAAAVGSDLTTFAAVKNESMRNWKRFCYSSVLNIKIMFKKYKFREKKTFMGKLSFDKNGLISILNIFQFWNLSSCSDQIFQRKTID